MGVFNRILNGVSDVLTITKERQDEYRETFDRNYQDGRSLTKSQLRKKIEYSRSLERTAYMHAYNDQYGKDDWFLSFCEGNEKNKSGGITNEL